MIILQGCGYSVDEVQDDETKTQHLVSCTILVDTTVQNMTSSWLLKVIIGIRVTGTMIN